MGQVARDIMKKDVICVHQDVDLRDLAKLFLENGITGAPVVDDEGSLVGVISQTDLLYYHLTRDDELVTDSSFYETARMEGGRLPLGFQIEDINTGRVSEVMTPVVHAVSESADIESIARLMTQKHIHRVIVRSGKKAAGIISALDLLQVITRKLGGRAKRTGRPATRAKPARNRAGARPKRKAAARS